MFVWRKYKYNYEQYVNQYHDEYFNFHDHHHKYIYHYHFAF
jgi:hypothetical protein